eukprot:CAMPEP_0204824466 /NCGR_PEP_ID=MMETSP1346-20131115/2488_1 /ASSEMBLY_ACC=CAM_ASM_000771 /TAXON_ID=215587 /ORGANISM="Aplanochytrium stocchinoi, Strain GSBS06" /LENGTH=325 /DNA_ID=CAMNT_0051951635 /DNA_START=322 /DNA_END=1299 /DNA_ORIENTATION=-
MEASLKNANRQPTRQLRLKRKIVGKEGGRVEQVKWGKDNQLLTLTSGASSLTSLLVWDAPSGIRTHLVIPVYSWLLASAIEQKEGTHVACGGLENICSVYKLESNQEHIEASVAELKQHDGYISDIKFFNGKDRILTASGDSECILWDVGTQTATEVFSGHDGDVTSISLSPTDPNVFVSGGVDNTVRVWDVRTRKSTDSFTADHEVNHVSYFPDGNAFVAALGNSECKLYDQRAHSLFRTFTSPLGNTSECKMAQFSNSGRLMFACYDDETCFAYDVAMGDQAPQRLDSDKCRAKCLDVHPQGYALAIGDAGSGKDTSVKIFWP